MKRTCEGCRALDTFTGVYTCAIHYEIDWYKGIPLEECPKPRTIRKLVDIQLSPNMRPLCLTSQKNRSTK